MNKRYLVSMLQIVKPWYRNRTGRKFENVLIRPFSSDTKPLDPYKVLGVEPGSSFDEVRNQYMKLSKQYHPDYNPGNEEAEAKFIALTKAYRALVKNIEKNRDASDTRGSSERTKIVYDFTVEPLGIETDKPKPVSIYKPLITVTIICVLGLAAIHVLRNVIYKVITSLEERVFKKSPREREKQLIEETRLAIIKYHKDQERLRELYEKASR